jgi:hypothetical protein
MKKTWVAFALLLLGLAILGVTAWFIVAGVKHPTAGLSIGIALLSAIGVPVALGIMSVGYRQFRGPNYSTLKTEAEAKERAAAALEDAETAEKIRAELNAYVIIRSWRLEIERRRQELTNATKTLLQMRSELNDMETQLDVETTKLSPETTEILDTILDTNPLVIFPDFRVWGMPVGKAANWVINMVFDSVEQHRLRQLASVAPEALQVSDAGKDDGSKIVQEKP